MDIGPQEVMIKRFDRQIESAERRLIHIPETSLPVALDDVKGMRRDVPHCQYFSTDRCYTDVVLRQVNNKRLVPEKFS